MASGTTSTTTEHWKEIVLLNYNRLVCDTDLYNAVDDCFEIGVFEEEEKDEVESRKIKNDKNREFLNILLNKHKNSFDNFLKSDFFQSKNDNIKELLLTGNVQITTTRIETEIKRRRQIFKYYREIVCQTSLRYMVDPLIAERVFEIEDWEYIRKRSNIKSEENRRFLNTLLTKSSGYELLLGLLRKETPELALKIEECTVDEMIDKERRFIEDAENTAEESVSKLKKRLQSHYEDYIQNMKVCDLESIVRILLQKGIITEEESSESLLQPDEAAEGLRKRKILEQIFNLDKEGLRIFFNRVAKFERTTTEREASKLYSSDKYLPIKIMMNKERIVEEDLDVDVILDKLISNFIIDIGSRYMFDHDNERCRKENLLYNLKRNERGWDTVIVEYMESNGFCDTAYNIINTDPGYQDWEAKLESKYGNLLKTDLKTLIETCEEYNLISSEKCKDFLKKSKEDCNDEFFDWIFKEEKVDDLRLVFYDVDRNLMKEIDGEDVRASPKQTDEMAQLEKQVVLNKDMIMKEHFHSRSLKAWLIENKVLKLKDIKWFRDKDEKGKRQAILDLLFQAKSGWGKHLIEFFVHEKLHALVNLINSTDVDQEDGTLPKEISDLGPNSVKHYKEAMKNGKEKRHHVRIMVVGAQGVGKSTLVNALFKLGYDVKQIGQTDGIDIHKNSCAICIKSGEWKFNDEFLKLLNDPKNRKVKAVIGKSNISLDITAAKTSGEFAIKEEVNQEMAENNTTSKIDEETGVVQTIKTRPEENNTEEMNKTSVTQIDESGDAKHMEKKLEGKTKGTKEMEATKRINESSYEVESQKTTSIKLKTHEEEIKEMTNIKQLPRDHCLVTVWDFGGHYVFYSTHQTFLTRRAVYLIVLNISRDLSKHVKELDVNFENQHGYTLLTEEEFFRFWIQSIICYGSTLEQVHPTVLVFLTYIDKIKPEEVDKKKLEYVRTLQSIAGEYSLNLPEANIVMVNATNVTDPKFDQVRQHLFEEARKQTYWGEYTPASYITMEEHLVLQKNLKIERVENIIPIAREVFALKEKSVQENQTVDTFLKYQHEIGNLIYFEEEGLREFVILNPKFLIDAFKCIFTFLEKDKRLAEFERNGNLDKAQIEEIWKEADLSQYTEYFLHLFTKLGIIVKRIQHNDEVTYFFAPGKLKKRLEPSRFELMISTSKKKSPILCFTSHKKFISPATTSKLLTACIGKWGDVVQEDGESGELMIYCDGVVIRTELDHQLLVAVIDGVLLICVSVPDSSNFEYYPFIRHFLIRTVNEINRSCSVAYQMKEYVKCPAPLTFANKQNCLVDVDDLVDVSLLMKKHDPITCLNNHAVNTEDILHIWGVDTGREPILHPEEISMDHIMNWKEEDETFFPTKVTEEIYLAAVKYRNVMVSGLPGAGKSANVHHIALLLKNQGHVICSVHTLKDIVQKMIEFGRNKKVVYVIDDVFGVNSINEESRKEWSDENRDELEQILNNTNIKILCTSRLQVTQDSTLSNIQSGFTIINVSQEENELTSEEKVEIFRKHASVGPRDDLLSDDITKKIRNIECPFGFPLLCRLYTKDRGREQSIDEYFNKSTSLLEDQLRMLQAQDSLGYFCLLMCLLYDNNLPETIFTVGEESEKTKMLREELLGLCELPISTPRPMIREKMGTLIETFFKLQGNTYSFVHDIVQEALIRHVSFLSSDVHKVILRHCSRVFLKERIHLSGVDCSNENLFSHDAKYCINIRPDEFSNWANRVIQSISDGINMADQVYTEVKEGRCSVDDPRLSEKNPWRDVFKNPCVQTEEGAIAIAMVLDGKSPSDVQYMFCSQGYSLNANGTPRHTALHWSVACGLGPIVTQARAMIPESKLQEVDLIDSSLPVLS